ncbi:MAG: SWIM zinc finger family protein, partial [Armatimonadetes bacterium]|nr:SWIM zinc finger family protein [Armatimonadota bacterium]
MVNPTLAEVLHERALRRMADTASFWRGTEYFAQRRVRGLIEQAGTVTAPVQGTQRYLVTLWPEGDELAYSCTCPVGEDGLFCKHCVAVGLAWLAQHGHDTGALAPEPTAAHAGRTTAPGGDGATVTRVLPDAGAALPPASSRFRLARSPVRSTVRPRQSPWQARLAEVQRAVTGRVEQNASTLAGRQILYVIDVPATRTADGLVVELVGRRRKANGEWGTPNPLRISAGDITRWPDPADRQTLSLLNGAGRLYGPWDAAYAYFAGDYGASSRYCLPTPTQDTLVPLMCKTGRCCLRTSPQSADLFLLEWDDGAPWDFWLEVIRDAKAHGYVVSGCLRRGQEQIALSTPALTLASGFVFVEHRCARLNAPGAFPWMGHLRRSGPLVVPTAQADDLLATLLALPDVPLLQLPDELRYEEVSPAPLPRLRVRPARPTGLRDVLWCDLSFDYDGAVIAAAQPWQGVFQRDRRRFIRREAAGEQRAEERLRELGVRPRRAEFGHAEHEWELAPRHLPRVVAALVSDGWHVEAEGKIFRRSGAFHIDVTADIDWFDLHGAVDYDGTRATLPAILEAVRRGETAVRLDDGTYGLLPEEWLARYGLLAGMGAPRGEDLRFNRSQVGVLDLLLASQPHVTSDEVFARARTQLRAFDGIRPADPPPAFTGTLRGYQREGLGWLEFLRRFGFGGCLADDMGLGKTVQVLALLASRRGDATAPSLVVMPKSLAFNWREEAARFTPDLRVFEHTGSGRAKPGPHFCDHDLIITTYGTLRRDAAQFAGVEFDYV